MNARDMLTRAFSAEPVRTIYKLGSGGMNPKAAHPKGWDGACDCSGFVAWAIGRSRQTTHPLYVRKNGGWINTDAMVHDAEECTGFFTLTEPKVGAIIVYGGHNQYRKVGHCGIVTSVDPLRVLHCSMGNYRRSGDAIQETGPEAFNVPDRIFAWYEGLEP